MNDRAAAVLEKRCWVRLTRTCNNHCMFCLDSGAQNGRIVPAEEVQRRIKEGRASGAQRLILSGGEPTIHPAFLDFVAFGREVGYPWIQTVTNGRMMGYLRFAQAAMANGLREATFSMHAHQPELFDRLVGVKGAFPQAIRGLKNALDLGLVVSVDVVLNRLNLPYLKEILEFYMSLGVMEFDLLYIIPFGRGFDEHRDELYPDPDMVRREVARAMTLASTPGLHLWTNRLPIEFLEGHEEYFQDPHKLYDEAMGERDAFKVLFATGREPDCLGPRCNHCFIKGFCDAARAYASGRYDAATPPAKPPLPVCLGGPGDCLYPAPDPAVMDESGRFNLARFVDFYIRRLYRVKSFRCRDCALDNVCQGVHVDFARRHGLGMLKPIRR